MKQSKKLHFYDGKQYKKKTKNVPISVVFCIHRIKKALSRAGQNTRSTRTRVRF